MSGGYMALAPQPPRIGARAPGDTDPVVLDWTPVLGAYQVCTAATPSSSGAGYLVNDLIYGPDGTSFRVLTVSGSAIATLGIVNSGLFLSATVPTNPQAVSTNNAGSGATINLTYGAADNIASIVSTSVSRQDGQPIGSGDLSIVNSVILAGSLQTMHTLAGGLPNVDYLISCTIVRASGPTLTRSAYQLVLSPLG